MPSFFSNKIASTDAYESPFLPTAADNPPNKVYWQEYLNVTFVFAFFLLMTAVITYDPSDGSDFVLQAQQQSTFTNFFGPFGANLAEWMYQLFGLGALLFSFIFFALLLNTLKLPRDKNRFLLRVFGFPQLIFCYLGLLTILSPHWHFKGTTFPMGGFIGHLSQDFFIVLFGKTGAIAALSFGILSSLTLSLGIRPLNTISYLLDRLPNSRAKKLKNAIVSDISIKEDDLSFVDKAIFSKKKTIPFTTETKKGEDVVNAQHFNDLIALLEKQENENARSQRALAQEKLQEEARLIEEKLLSYNVKGNVISSKIGPVINIHEFEPAAGIKVNKVFSLQDDLTLGLKAESVLIDLQPGKSTLGIEIPALFREMVSLRESFESPEFKNNKIPLPMALGKKTDGSPLVTDLSAMPHLLVAGATGSGKSVCINVILLSLMISRTPQQLRFILIDPKMLELSQYDDVGHLLMPVVTDPTKAAGALKWAIQEMERRYLLMKKYQVRNIAAFNEGIERGTFAEEETPLVSLPYIVVVIDELCDLMMTAPKDVEDSIQRLAQKARAAGIHLILATQRPSVDVITGVIKANLPCRLSFQVASRHDSRTIIEDIGAERLLGKGDMLFLPPGVSKVTRAQCAFVSDKEIHAVTNRLRELYNCQYESSVIDEINRVSEGLRQKIDGHDEFSDAAKEEDNALDENTLYEKSIDFAQQLGHISTSGIQREFRIGYNRAARIMDRMVREGVVGASESAGKPRPVLKKFI